MVHRGRGIPCQFLQRLMKLFFIGSNEATQRQQGKVDIDVMQDGSLKIGYHGCDGMVEIKPRPVKFLSARKGLQFLGKFDPHDWRSCRTSLITLALWPSSSKPGSNSDRLPVTAVKMLLSSCATVPAR